MHLDVADIESLKWILSWLVTVQLGSDLKIKALLLATRGEIMVRLTQGEIDVLAHVVSCLQWTNEANC